MHTCAYICAFSNKYAFNHLYVAFLIFFYCLKLNICKSVSTARLCNCVLLRMHVFFVASFTYEIYELSVPSHGECSFSKLRNMVHSSG